MSLITWAHINHLDLDSASVDTVNNAITADSVTPQSQKPVFQGFPQFGLFANGFQSGAYFSFESGGQMQEDLLHVRRDDETILQLPGPNTCSRDFPRPPLRK